MWLKSHITPTNIDGLRFRSAVTELMMSFTLGDLNNDNYDKANNTVRDSLLTVQCVYCTHPGSQSALTHLVRELFYAVFHVLVGVASSSILFTSNLTLPVTTDRRAGRNLFLSSRPAFPALQPWREAKYSCLFLLVR